MGDDLDLSAVQNASNGNSDSQKMMTYTTQKKSEALAVVLSFFIPGLGQMVTGYFGKGIIFFLVEFVLAVMAFILSFIFIGLLLWPVWFGIWIWNLIDAYLTIKKFNTDLMLKLQND